MDSSNIPSEAIALNCAVVAGIIADFLGDEEIVSTVSGRMGSGVFDFSINNLGNDSSYTVTVNNSQIEIDAAYEGIRSLALFEAKRDLSDDFLVRQLYYPYRVWKNRVTKPVRPLFWCILTEFTIFTNISLQIQAIIVLLSLSSSVTIP